jgi:hypothetical protein
MVSFKTLVTDTQWVKTLGSSRLKLIVIAGGILSFLLGFLSGLGIDPVETVLETFLVSDGGLRS